MFRIANRSLTLAVDKCMHFLQALGHLTRGASGQCTRSRAPSGIHRTLRPCAGWARLIRGGLRSYARFSRSVGRSAVPCPPNEPRADDVQRATSERQTASGHRSADPSRRVLSVRRLAGMDAGRSFPVGTRPAPSKLTRVTRYRRNSVCACSPSLRPSTAARNHGAVSSCRSRPHRSASNEMRTIFPHT